MGLPVIKTIGNIEKLITNKTFLDIIKRAGGFEKLTPKLQKLIISSESKIQAARFINHPAVKQSIARSNTIQQRFFPGMKPMVRRSTPKTKILDKSEFLKEAKKQIEERNGLNNKDLKAENVGGFYDPSTHTVVLPFTPIITESQLRNALSTGFHEHLHGFGYGPSDVTKWKIKFLNPEEVPYFLTDVEAPVHAAQLGKYKYGITPGQPYPGDQQVLDMLWEQGVGGAPLYFRRTTPKELRRFWRTLNGTYFKNGGKI